MRIPINSKSISLGTMPLSKAITFSAKAEVNNILNKTFSAIVQFLWFAQYTLFSAIPKSKSMWCSNIQTMDVFPWEIIQM